MSNCISSSDMSLLLDSSNDADDVEMYEMQSQLSALFASPRRGVLLLGTQLSEKKNIHKYINK